MRIGLLVALIASPVMVFLLALHRDVTLVPLNGFEATCASCNRRATRTLKAAAVGLKTKGVYAYDRNRYSNPPVWCDLHGPEKAQENASVAFFSGIASFLVVASIYKYLPD